MLTSLDKAIGVKCSYDLDSITGEAVLFIKYVFCVNLIIDNYHHLIENNPLFFFY